MLVVVWSPPDRTCVQLPRVQSARRALLAPDVSYWFSTQDFPVATCECTAPERLRSKMNAPVPAINQAVIHTGESADKVIKNN